jgi:acetyl esterase/lipase
MWIGDRTKAAKFVLFFHGGGYMQPINSGHLEWCLRSFVLGIKEAEVAVACLQYGLAPTLQYPGKLRQAVAALNRLLASGITPRQIVIGGDSAGGHLAFDMLAHMLRPSSGC